MPAYEPAQRTGQPIVTHSDHSDAIAHDWRQLLVDGLILTAIVVASAFPYIGRLGFYSDDWAFLGAFANAPHQSLGEMFAVMHDASPERPVLSLYFAALYRVFGIQALGYHVVNHGVMALTALLFYLCLRRLGVPRVLSLAWPIVFELLPHYATDRLWYSTFQAQPQRVSLLRQPVCGAAGADGRRRGSCLAGHQRRGAGSERAGV